MHTISDIVSDIRRGCAANNMVENAFSYRIIYYVNMDNTGRKHYVDTPYSGLRPALENIIRGNLSLTNSVVIAQTTVLMNGHCIRLQSRPYQFSMEGYFNHLTGKSKNGSKKRNAIYGGYVANIN